MDEEIVEVSFRIYGVGSDSFEGLYFFSKGEFIPFEFRRTTRSAEKYRYKGPPSLGIYVENPNYLPSSLDELPYIRVSELLFLESAEETLIVFAANPQNRSVASDQRRYVLFAIDDSKEVFPRNTIIFLNITGARLYGKIGDETVILPNGPSHPINYSAYSEESKAIPIQFALETSEGPKLAMSNDMVLSTDRRIIFFLQPPKRERSLRIQVRMLVQAIYPEEIPQQN